MKKRTTPRPDAYIDRSPQGFADRSGLSLSHTYNLMRSGKLKAVKSGNRTIIPEKFEHEYWDSLPEFKSKSGRPDNAHAPT